MANRTYIISDIHGCYNSFSQLLEKIEFSSTDRCIILGDAVDRGPEPMKVMQKIMQEENIEFILGNHDVLFYSMMQLVQRQIIDKRPLTEEEREVYQMWRKDGGLITEESFLALDFYEQAKILECIEKAPAYKELYHEGKRYVLAHGGIDHFKEGKSLDEYDLYDFLEGRTDYSKPLFEDENTILITGHTPTFFINGINCEEIYRSKGHIAIDCGASYHVKLAAYCIETGEATYVDGIRMK